MYFKQTPIPRPKNPFEPLLAKSKKPLAPLKSPKAKALKEPPATKKPIGLSQQALSLVKLEEPVDRVDMTLANSHVHSGSCLNLALT